MKTVPYTAEHMARLKLQESQAWLSRWVDGQQAAVLESTLSRTILDDERVYLCGGIFEFWPGRGLLWAYVDANAGDKFVRVHREVMRFINEHAPRRLEATVDAGFEQGHRWIQMLGFVCEAPFMAAFLPDGRGSSLYARVRH